MQTTAGSDVLVVSGLRHAFPGMAEDRVALDVSDLSFRRGALTVITGPSGSGKTTLLYVLSGLLRPRQGRISWDGLDIAALGESARDRWRHRHAGFVFQNFNLIDEMAPLDNVTVAANFSAFSDAQFRQRGAELLALFGVPNEARRVDTFSRGEQQRVALARALIFDPGVLFADEPTASLDAINGAALAAQLQGLADKGKTVIAVSHDPVLIEQADDRVELDHGRIVAPAVRP